MQVQLADQKLFSFGVPPGDAATVSIVRGGITHVLAPPGDFNDEAAVGQLATGQAQRFTSGAVIRGEGFSEVTIEWESHQPPELPDPPTQPDPEEEP